MRIRRSHEELEALLLNKRFERLLVYGSIKTGWHRMWQVRCDCGKEFVTRAKALFTGRTKSCGCFARDRITSHGMSGSREYKTYHAMLKRCYTPTNKDFHNYGGRGIKVCARWLESFENFYEDMGDRPENTSLDRIDSNGNYELQNCKWSTNKEQANNRRNNVVVTYKGITSSLKSHCDRLKTCEKTIQEKVKKGLSFDEAFQEVIDRRLRIAASKLPKPPRVIVPRLMNGKLGPHKGSTTGYKGVTTFKKLNKFDAVIHVNKKSIYIGRFETKEEAALAYNEAALKHFGPDAYFNEIKQAA